MHLYETHLPVANTRASVAFYVEVLGMTFAYRDPSRDIAFLWIEENRRSMLGLWGPGTEYGAALHKSHLAISVTLPELVTAGKKLNDSGIRTFNFAREETTEPSVIGWMPSAQLYFEDPDGHLLEFISLLDDQPEPYFIGSLSEWNKRASLVANGKP
jgi:lactoylglutathione lyase